MADAEAADTPSPAKKRVKKVVKKGTKKAGAKPAAGGPPPPPPAPGSAPKKKVSKKPGGKKASPAGSTASKSPKKSGKKAVKKGVKKAVRKSASKGSPTKSPKSSPKKSAKKSVKKGAKKSAAKVAKTAPEDGDAAAEASPEEAAPAAPEMPLPTRQFLPPPGYAGGAVGLPPSPLVPPPPHRHPYQPYELNPKKEEHRRKLVEYYMKHNPAKVAHVDDILKQWEGEEDLLMLRLKERYEVPKGDAARHISVAQPIFAEGAGVGGRRHAHDTDKAVARMALDARLAEVGEEQEKRIREQEERTHTDVKNRLANALRDLQGVRRQDAMRREERRLEQAKEAEARDTAAQRGMEKAVEERRQMETLIHEREHQQLLREEEITRRERSLRESMQARAERMLSMVDPYTASPEVRAHQSLARAAGGGMESPASLAGAADVLTNLHSENRQLKDELHRLHADAAGLPDASPGGGRGVANTYFVKGVGGNSRAFPSPPRSLMSKSPGMFTPDRTPARPPPPQQQHQDPARAAADPVEPPGGYPPSFAPVAACLRAAGLAKYVPVFQAHDFDIDAFRKLEEDDLRELGITGVGARKRIETEAQRQKLEASVAQDAQRPTAAIASPSMSPSPYAPVYAGAPGAVAEAHPLPVDHAPIVAAPHWIPIADGKGSDAEPSPEEESPPRVTHIHHHTGATYADQQVTQSRLKQMEDKIDQLADLLSTAQSPSPAPESPAGYEEEWEEWEEYEEPLSPAISSPPRRTPSPMIVMDPVLEWHRDLLTRFYQTFDPVKLSQVTRILGEYHDRMDDLYDTLNGIYAIEVSPYTDKVRATCIRYAPGKAPAAATLCRLCQGREAELIEHLMTDGLSTTDGAVIEKTGRWRETEDDASGRIYYFSLLAREAQWSKPAALIDRDNEIEYAIKETYGMSKRLAGDRIPFSCADPHAPDLPSNPSPHESMQYHTQRGHAQEARVMHYKAWVLAFFNSYDPPRAVEVDHLLAQWRGQEQAMVAALKKQYRVA